jgi:hypothetical protein
MSAVHPANTPVDREVQDAGLAMIALGAGLGRTRDDTGWPVGSGGRARSGTPNGPVG